VRAGSASPAPPGMASGEVSGSAVAVSVSDGSVSDRSVAVSTGLVSACVATASVLVDGAVDAASSSPPHPAHASSSAKTPARASFRVNSCGQMPIAVSAESHNAGTMDTR
jgi:hypothetical protein